MGIYLNPDSSKFEEAVNSDIYVDKTGLLAYTNSVLHTMQKYICDYVFTVGQPAKTDL